MILNQLLFERFLLVPPKRMDYWERINHLMNQIGFVKRRYGDFFVQDERIHLFCT